LVAAFNYASKKTQKTVDISFATLEGAAIMNNTFCLGIFLMIIYINGSIAWTFSAETISIILVQLLMAAMAQKKTHRLLDGIIVILFYPLSLLVVALIEKFTTLN
jgi:hypothetical protein